MNEEKINNLALFFKVFSDSTRLKIINALLKKELNVCELANVVEISQSAVSHQLQFLKLSKLKNSIQFKLFCFAIFLLFTSRIVHVLIALS